MLNDAAFVLFCRVLAVQQKANSLAARIQNELVCAVETRLASASSSGGLESTPSSLSRSNDSLDADTRSDALLQAQQCLQTVQSLQVSRLVDVTVTLRKKKDLASVTLRKVLVKFKCAISYSLNKRAKAKEMFYGGS